MAGGRAIFRQLAQDVGKKWSQLRLKVQLGARGSPSQSWPLDTVLGAYITGATGQESHTCTSKRQPSARQGVRLTKD
eukprot:scaffold1558_cov403-Prasinococcus_capsulatus_cf.AAC.22